MLGYGLPLVPAALAFWAFSIVDRTVLTALKGAEETGLYAPAVRVAGVIAFLTFAANSAFVPLALKISDRPDARRVYARCLTGFCCVVAWGALGLSALAREAIAILAPPEYGGGSRAVAPLAFGTALAGTAPFLTIGIHVLQRTWHIAWVAAAATGATVLLCFALVPAFGLFGAAGATLLGNAILTVLYFLVGRRIYPIPFEGGRLLRIALLAGASVAAVLLLDRPGTGFVVARLGVALAFPPLLLLAGVLRLREIRGLLASFGRA